MKVEWLALRGAAMIRADRLADVRGDFTIHLSPNLSAQFMPQSEMTKIASAYNRVAGTIRGLHVQLEPFPERKTLWCTSGAVYDVLLDVRPESDTYGRWASVYLNERAVALHIPAGVAHGYQTLSDHTVVTYMIQGQFHEPSARTIRWDDPTLQIPWPRAVTSISDKDREGELWIPEP